MDRPSDSADAAGYGNGDNMPDEKLLPLFDKINLRQGKHFIVLHQRGSHVPYGALLQPQDKVFGEAILWIVRQHHP